MKIYNKRARFDYDIKESFEAGISLYGAEVKAIRLNQIDINGSYVRIMNSEAYLVGAKIYPYKFARPDNYSESRSRKLLLHKKQIISLKSKIDGLGLSLFPISLYIKGHLIKVEVGLGKGKKEYQKKEAIKRRDVQRDIEQELKLASES
ncbi:MAG TPA: SsrA-binding protein SmpB [Patescibacteria group bacterium]|nr:SsrA-binding protein SmpB [Patescibacteria group bacterium]